MTARNIIEKLIRAWGSAPRSLTWSVLFLMVNYVILMIGCSNNWLESSVIASGYEFRTQGLFYFCYDFRGIECCGRIDDVMQIERKFHSPSQYACSKTWYYLGVHVFFNHNTILKILNLY